MFVALMINGLVIGAGIGGAYFFTVIVQGGSAGAFLSSFTALATPATTSTSRWSRR